MLSDNDLIQARHRLAAGRILAIKQFPYYHTAMMSMVTVEMPGLGKFAVDKRWRMYFDPALCLRWSPEEIAAEWIHNVEHIIRKHEERFKSLEGSSHDHQVYNAAADAAINSDLKSQGIIMPDPETRFYAEKNDEFPTWKKSMSAEEMYFSSRGASVFGDDPSEDTATPSGQNPDETKEDSDSSQDNSKEPSESSESDSEKSEKKDDSSKESSDEKNSGKSEEDSSSENSKDEQADGDTSKSSKEKSDSSPESGKEESSDNPSDESENSSDEDASKNSDKAAEEGSDGSGDDSKDDGASPSPNDDSKEGKGKNPSANDNGEESEEPNDDEIQLHRDGSVDSGDFQEIGDKQEPSKDESLSGGESSDGGASQEEDGKPSGKPLPDCGSAAGGAPREYERKDDEEDGSVDPATANSLLEKTAKEIQSYAERNPGKVPGGLLREAKNILEPQIDWMDEFLALFRSVVAKISGYSNYSYARPSRRSSGSDFIMPILRNPPAPETAIVLDTSGSMDESKEIAMALAEMEDILNRVARFSETQSVKVINCDAAATSVVALRDMDDFEIIGGGGTDMRVGIKAAAEINPRMDIILVITDGGTPWPKEIPKENPYATYIVLLVGTNAKWNKALPEWMNVIEVKIPQKRFGLKMR